MLGNPRLAVSLVVLMAAPAGAIPNQTIISFDDLPLGTTDFSVDTGHFVVFISGGTVVTLPPSESHSGTQGYSGTSIHIATADAFDFSLPAIGAWISAGAPVTLQAFEYDYTTGAESALPPVFLHASSVAEYLSVGTEAEPRYISSADFSADFGSFVMDDLTLGLENVLPGIPEPGSWATMLAGLCLVGGALRRRKVSVCFGHVVKHGCAESCRRQHPDIFPVGPP